MTLKGDLPPTMEAAAVLDLANTGMERLLASLYPDRDGLHASDMTDLSAWRPTLAARRKMLAGHYVEQKWLAAFQAANVLLPRCQGETNLNGRDILYHPDAVIREGGVDPADVDWRVWRPSDYLIEIKSVGSDVFTEVQQERGPWRKHVLRTELYLLFSGILRGFLIYENRDTCVPLVIPIGPLIPERRAELEAYVAQKTEPFSVEDGRGTTDAALGLSEAGDLGREPVGGSGVGDGPDRNEVGPADQPEAPDVVAETPGRGGLG